MSSIRLPRAPAPRAGEQPAEAAEPHPRLGLGMARTDTAAIRLGEDRLVDER